MAEGGMDAWRDGLVFQLQQMFPQFGVDLLKATVQNRTANLELPYEKEVVLNGCIDYLLASSLAFEDDEPDVIIVEPQEPALQEINTSPVDITSGPNVRYANRKRKYQSPQAPQSKNVGVYDHEMSDSDGSDLPDLGSDFSNVGVNYHEMSDGDGSDLPDLGSDFSEMINDGSFGIGSDDSDDQLGLSRGHIDTNASESAESEGSVVLTSSEGSSLDLPDIIMPKRRRQMDIAPVGALGVTFPIVTEPAVPQVILQAPPTGINLERPRVAACQNAYVDKTKRIKLPPAAAAGRAPLVPVAGYAPPLIEEQERRLKTAPREHLPVPPFPVPPALGRILGDEPEVVPDPKVVLPPEVVSEPVVAEPHEPTPAEVFEEKVTTVLSLFPLVEPEYVRTTMQHFEVNEVEFMVNHLLEATEYPKREQKKKCVPDKVEACDYLDLERIASHHPSIAYMDMCVKLLQADFRRVSVKDIRKLCSLQHFCYGIIHNTLSDAQTKSGVNLKETRDEVKRKKARATGSTFKTTSSEASSEVSSIQVVVQLDGSHTSTMELKLLKVGRPNDPRSLSIPWDPILKDEVSFMSQRNKVADEEKDRRIADELLEKEAEATGQLIECGCCYGDCPFEHMVQCYEGHLFCRDCLKNYAKEAVYGQGKSELTCMSDGCETTFPIDQLKRALPSEMIDKYDERLKEEALNLADLTDLVRCPHCDFAAVLPPDDKVFSCQNPDCLKETCRYCKEEWTEHFGIPCKELEKKDETKMRVAYEEKMALAVMRVCHRCKTSFMKTDGCNRMTCRCKATMCYICRKPDITYEHFCRDVREPGKPCTKCTQCSLWSNPEEDDERAVQEIKKEALEDRKAKGFEDHKNIGAPDEPKKPLAVQQPNADMPHPMQPHQPPHQAARVGRPQVAHVHQPQAAHGRHAQAAYRRHPQAAHIQHQAAHGLAEWERGDYYVYPPQQAHNNYANRNMPHQGYYGEHEQYAMDLHYQAHQHHNNWDYQAPRHRNNFHR